VALGGLRRLNRGSNVARLINARAVDEFDAALEPRFPDCRRTHTQGSGSPRFLSKNDIFPSKTTASGAPGAHLAGLGERLAFERIDPGLRPARSRFAASARGYSVLRNGDRKRRLSEDSKRDNDHNELSVLANSFQSPVRLSN
jgi:hypothetical protein